MQDHSVMSKRRNVTFLKDYRPPDYQVSTVELHFELGEEEVLVRSRMALNADYEGAGEIRPLRLDGRGLELVSVTLEGERLTGGQYLLDEESLILPEPPRRFILEIETVLKPRSNSSLEGLYQSGGNFCTQCEAEGFRKITYYPDRPDVMALFSTTIIADRERYPVLLSNGNRVDGGELSDGRHWVKWEDPFPKPCYLFALVAGDLAHVSDRFTTCSGRAVKLKLYVERHNLHKCAHAIRSLKRAMAWDERVYGREYDLDCYMIVAVDDFNMGAMENKGLNIFNSKFVLASPETATDTDFQYIEGVVAHEYFHNWSGNRVTCRDWFQLSLKEGFTVFRDQEFSADMGSRAVQRIGDVNRLRNTQFPEDHGPLAHPVRPDSYVEINNFYTATVYEKGAEVVRMIHTLVGAEGFRAGTDLYFQRHDGQAVTTDDFVSSMEEANRIDLGQFRRWYSQAGTPRIEVSDTYDAASCRYTLRLVQSCPATPGQARKLPFHIPVEVALLDDKGEELAGGQVLELREPEQLFHFEGIGQRPIPSLLRGFSAPVILRYAYSQDQLAFLMTHDTDPFNRWEAGQQLATGIILPLADGRCDGRQFALDDILVGAFRKILTGNTEDPAFTALLLTLPSESWLAEQCETVDPVAIHDARSIVRRVLASRLEAVWLAGYEANNAHGEYRVDAISIGRRSLKNLCLSYLMELPEESIRQGCFEQFTTAGNMTDTMAALQALANCECPEREPALDAFYQRWRDDALVVDKWFSLQATSRLPGTLARVKKLLEHPAFDMRNPNRVRALIGAFSQGNPARFHQPGGAGYRFLAEQVLELDRINPQVAARVLNPLTRWQRYDEQRQRLMKMELERIASAEPLSRDVYEIVSRSLNRS